MEAGRDRWPRQLDRPLYQVAPGWRAPRGATVLARFGRALDSLGPGIEPDELALELSDDALSAARRAVEAGELPRAVRDGLLALDARFARMSGPQAAAFWTRAALADNPEWEAIRQQARTLLDEIAADAACGQHVVSMQGSR